MKELDFQTALIRAAERDGHLGYKVRRTSGAGFPDIVLIVRTAGLAWVIFVETKRRTVASQKQWGRMPSVPNGMTALQKFTAANMMKIGATVLVCTLIEIGSPWVDRYVVVGRPNDELISTADAERWARGKPFPIWAVVRSEGVKHGP